MIILLMGVTGAGKTTVGRALAEQLHCRFADADDYHSAANIAKMRAGSALTDTDRAPWLQALHDAIARWIRAGENVVLACSALKAAYRERLVVGPEVKLVYLKAEEALIAARVAARTGSYMNPQLVPSQFATLEEPSDALVVDARENMEQIVRGDSRGARDLVARCNYVGDRHCLLQRMLHLTLGTRQRIRAVICGTGAVGTGCSAW